MGIYSEQINLRAENDALLFEEAIQQIGDAVMGARISDALRSDSKRAKGVLNDVLKSFGFKPSDIPESIEDFDEQMEYAMRPHGIMWRNVKLEPGWEHNAVGTMIGLFKETGRVVALIPKGSGGYSYYDEEAKRVVSVNRKSEALFDTEAITFYRPLPQGKVSREDFIRFMFSTWSHGDTAAIIVCFAVIALLGLFTPVFSKYLFSTVAFSNNMKLLIAAAVAITCITLSTKLFKAVKNLTFESRQIKMSTYTESAVMTRLLNLPADFFKKYSSGNLSSRIFVIRELVAALLNAIFEIGLTAVMSLIYLFQIFTFAAPLALPAILVLIVSLTVSVLALVSGARMQKEILEIDARESGLIYGLITGVRKIRSSGSEKRAFAKWGEDFSQKAKIEYNPPFFVKYSEIITIAASLLGTVLIYFLAVKNNIALADYYAFSTAFSMTSAAFILSADSVWNLSEIGPAIEMLKPILEAEPEVDEKRMTIGKMRGDIEISHVSFRYGPRLPLILDDFSLKIKRGQYVAVVGKTGCGKSTLIRLLLGFEKPESGSIYYDDKDINSLDLKSLRKKIGCVIQGGKLLTESIYTNIAASAPELTMDEAWEAAEIAGMADEIRKMPMGMHTLITEGTGGISGGQRQRILIARAIAPKPKILIFDEATSALDNITQKKVSNALDSLKCTRIVIAHRLSTIKNCDRIVVLDKGKIIEDGTYDELIEKNGFFAELVARQRI